MHWRKREGNASIRVGNPARDPRVLHLFRMLDLSLAPLALADLRGQPGQDRAERDRIAHAGADHYYFEGRVRFRFDA